MILLKYSVNKLKDLRAAALVPVGGVVERAKFHWRHYEYFITVSWMQLNVVC